MEELLPLEFLLHQNPFCFLVAGICLNSSFLPAALSVALPPLLVVAVVLLVQVDGALLDLVVLVAAVLVAHHVAVLEVEE